MQGRRGLHVYRTTLVMRGSISKYPPPFEPLKNWTNFKKLRLKIWNNRAGAQKYAVIFTDFY